MRRILLIAYHHAKGLVIGLLSKGTPFFAFRKGLHFLRRRCPFLQSFDDKQAQDFLPSSRRKAVHDYA